MRGECLKLNDLPRWAVTLNGIKRQVTSLDLLLRQSYSIIKSWHIKGEWPSQ